ncbi:Tol-Pal system beta propeller repeat protein TolB [Thiohalorhabdus sp.]|uniref:Tol-Pal system beta propeller repeat protein TolB n=1 Tax=Thiohalorhabdus sp. TaxID=3094134 RepID=UPI002FC2BCCF
MMRILPLLAAVVLAGWVPAAGAVLSIDIRQGVRDPFPVAVVPFGWEGEGERPFDLGGLVAGDLKRSGLFRPVDPKAFLSRPHSPNGVTYKDWRLVGADALVIGRMLPAAEGQVEVRFRLFDVYDQAQLTGVRYVVDAGKLREVGHRIADRIHTELVGWSGAFNTRLAYVVKEDGRFRLMVADADGANPRTVLTSGEPVMSPAWGPEGKRLAYVSFERGGSTVYVQDLESGKRSTLAAYEGINSAPVFSPEGEKLALTLSKAGNPELYVLDLGSRRMRRLTRSGGIDTEPTWGPEGENLVFTSDRGGTPQLYRVAATGGEPERLTFEGRYNAAPSWSPRGDRLAFVHGDGNRFAIAVMELDSGSMRTVTGFGLNEAPSFAPNGRMILYATQGPGGAGELATVSVDGNVQQRIQRERSGDVREPAWSPLPE